MTEVRGVPLDTKQQRPWIRKARAFSLPCHCFTCLRKIGVTPGKDSEVKHRSEIFTSGRVFDVASGRPVGEKGQV